MTVEINNCCRSLSTEMKINNMGKKDLCEDGQNEFVLNAYCIPRPQYFCSTRNQYCCPLCVQTKSLKLHERSKKTEKEIVYNISMQ